MHESACRQQINVLRRRMPKRPHLNNTDRFLLGFLIYSAHTQLRSPPMASREPRRLLLSAPFQDSFRKCRYTRARLGTNVRAQNQPRDCGFEISACRADHPTGTANVFDNHLLTQELRDVGQVFAPVHRPMSQQQMQPSLSQVGSASPASERCSSAS
jgi:hypothetical protein